MNGLVRAMRDGDQARMQDFDGNIEKLIRAGVVDLETGLAFATNPGNLRFNSRMLWRSRMRPRRKRM